MSSVSPPQTLQTKKTFHQKRRIWTDRGASALISTGGYSVIIAILLIFVYLLAEVLPLFGDIQQKQVAEYSVSGTADNTLLMALDEKGEIGVRYTQSAQAVFFETATGAELSVAALPLVENEVISTMTEGTPNKRLYAMGTESGKAIVFRQHFDVSYPNDVRTVTPRFEFPLGEAVIALTEQPAAVQKIAVQSSEEGGMLVAWFGGAKLTIASFMQEESLFEDEVSLERENAQITLPFSNVAALLLDKDMRRLYVANELGELVVYEVGSLEEIQKVETVQLTNVGSKLIDLKFLTGDISLLVSADDGVVSQWFPVQGEDTLYRLKNIRHFSQAQSKQQKIMPEFNRKVFMTFDEAGRYGIYHTTAERTLLLEKIMSASVHQTAISPRASAVLVLDANNKMHYLHIDNEHPEISWSSLWEKVWYESYPEPEYVWQSSSADNDFEPKLSLAPLAFGTLKAAFYALLMAVPLAIFGAVYTAYFMSPKLRSIVKPSIEIMEALPTVILGFLAGLWLAPAVEEYLSGIFTMLLIVPLGTLVSAYLLQNSSLMRNNSALEGWHAAIMMPIIALLIWLSLALNQPVQDVFFGGDIQSWLTKYGINFDQRNSIVVGLVMGFAVIPTIFSIAEDSVFGVPKHLTTGSLALGATPWQTLTKVVLLTASPGIFSAVMIGFGRAVGETMIVLMATGNTPIMDFSMFQGFRTLSANIAVEMPEAEVDSTHYRVLFLAALVLFGFTFFFNTLADMVRQRLRKQYGSL